MVRQPPGLRAGRRADDDDPDVRAGREVALGFDLGAGRAAGRDDLAFGALRV